MSASSPFQPTPSDLFLPSGFGDGQSFLDNLRAHDYGANEQEQEHQQRQQQYHNYPQYDLLQHLPLQQDEDWCASTDYSRSDSDLFSDNGSVGVSGFDLPHPVSSQGEAKAVAVRALECALQMLNDDCGGGGGDGGDNDHRRGNDQLDRHHSTSSDMRCFGERD